jgi:hypothetical protein
VIERFLCILMEWKEDRFQRGYLGKCASIFLCIKSYQLCCVLSLWTRHDELCQPFFHEIFLAFLIHFTVFVLYPCAKSLFPSSSPLYPLLHLLLCSPRHISQISVVSFLIRNPHHHSLTASLVHAFSTRSSPKLPPFLFPSSASIARLPVYLAVVSLSF